MRGADSHADLAAVTRSPGRLLLPLPSLLISPSQSLSFSLRGSSASPPPPPPACTPKAVVKWKGSELRASCWNRGALLLGLMPSASYLLVQRPSQTLAWHLQSEGRFLSAPVSHLSLIHSYAECFTTPRCSVRAAPPAWSTLSSPSLPR